MTLTQLQKDLIFGSLLGDGNLQTDTGGKTWRYRALQCSQHKDYLFHKYEILKPLCGQGTVPKEGLIVDPRTGNLSRRWWFNTLTQPELKFFGDMFYTYDSIQQKWIKEVPLKCQLFLTPTALTYFYMDDGSWLGHSNAMRICTEGFKPEGVKRLQNSITKLYNLKTTTSKISEGSVHLRLLIPEKSSQAFREIIQPYLVDCMKYKVSDGNKGHL